MREPSSTTGTKVSVHVPPEVFNDLEKFQRVQGSVFGRLGHPGCTSGFQIDWKVIREFVVNPELEVQVGPLVTRVG